LNTIYVYYMLLPECLPTTRNSLSKPYVLICSVLQNSTLWCWIASFPLNCTESAAIRGGVGYTDCLRGDNAHTIYRWAFFYVPLWCGVAFATVAMGMVIRTVFLHEKRTDKYTHPTIHSLQQQQQQQAQSTSSQRASSNGERRQSPSSLGSQVQQSLPRSVLVVSQAPIPTIFTDRRKRTRQVAIQALFYVGAFYLTWIFPTITRIMQSVYYFGDESYALVLLTVVCGPLQGLYNFFVYVRPRWMRHRAKRRKMKARLVAASSAAPSATDASSQLRPDKRRILKHALSYLKFLGKESMADTETAGAVAVKDFNYPVTDEQLRDSVRHFQASAIAGGTLEPHQEDVDGDGDDEFSMLREDSGNEEAEQQYWNGGDAGEEESKKEEVAVYDYSAGDIG